MKSRVRRLHSQADSLVSKFQQGGGMSYIDVAVALDRKALRLCPPGHQERSVSLTRLAFHLSHRYFQVGNLADLDEGVVLNREALGLHPPGNPERWTSLTNLACCLYTRYQQLEAQEDLDEAIVLTRGALDLCLPEHLASRFTSINNLAIYLSSRYKRFNVIEDLNEGIALEREVLGFRLKGDPNRSTRLNDLACDLSVRYKQLGAIEDINEAISLDRKALELCLLEHPDRFVSLHNLAIHLFARYEQLGALEDLKEVIVLDRDVLELHPPGHPRRWKPLINLAAFLFVRYQRLGELEDLDESIILTREALDLHPPGHPDRWMPLNNLASSLSARYQQLGGVKLLDEAIVLAREALHLRLQGHPDRPMSLSNLAIHLFSRYNQLGAMEDFDEAIVLDREALDLRPPGHPDRSMSLYNLAIRLSTRYEELEKMEDLEEAIILDQEALDLRPPGNPYRSMCLNSLASCLSVRFNQLGEIADLDNAIVLHQEAVDLRPRGHPDRWMSLSNLADCFYTYYKKRGATEYLDNAIVLAREALAYRVPGSPYQSRSLDNLARCLRTRFTETGHVEDLEALFSLYARLADVPPMVSSGDLSTARGWIRAAEYFQHPSIVLAYETSLQFLIHHLSTLPSLPHHLSILKNLTSSLAVDAFSACLRNRAPARAVELLEQGRSVFWNQLTRLRSPLGDVIKSSSEGKSLADEFTRLASLIRNSLDLPGRDQHERVCHLNVELQRVVTNIRELPGFSRFLLPSLFSDLQQAAFQGPVIIVNASRYSCDALVVLLDRDPVHIPLQITQESVRDLSTELHTLTERAKRVDVARQLAFMLRRIWDLIVSPVVDFLRTTIPHQSRIWWCPTAEFSLLPLHAAGPYRKGQCSLVDFYVSSYTPTLDALIRARRPSPSSPATREKRFVAIGQAKATGQVELPSVGTELANIARCVDKLAMFTRIEGPESCISRVSEELGKNEWVHLACHGLPNPKRPFESAFALYDGRFAIEHIIRCDLENPEFAYLSACHTTVGDEESPDEVIHLASAMQFAGFRSVIGTMWAVDDGKTSTITSTFYKHMVDGSGRLDHTRAASALNKTMRSVDVPLDQRILYVHLGA